MSHRTYRAILALVLSLSLLSASCAHFSKKQTGIISTAPVGAKITIRDDLGVFYKGVTPTEIEIQQGALPVWVIIEKEGYETIKYKVPTKESLDRHFVLKRQSESKTS